MCPLEKVTQQIKMLRVSSISAVNLWGYGTKEFDIHRGQTFPPPMLFHDVLAFNVIDITLSPPGWPPGKP